MALNITPAVQAVLANLTIEPRAVIINDGQLDRKLYADVNKVLVALGGKWDRRSKAHIFETDPADAIEEVVLTGTYTDGRKEYDAFYTPADIAELVVDLADIAEGVTVLEPSAGAGALAIPALARGAAVTAYELRDAPACGPWWSDFDGHVSFGVDFLAVTPPRFHDGAAGFDRVIMNPPFSRQQDIAHVLHALKFVRRGGKVVSVMSPSWQWRENGASRAFRQVLDSDAVADYEVTAVAPHAFRSSGTDVNTLILTVDLA